jgi:hypothetical protein
MRKHGCVFALSVLLTSGVAEAQRVAPQPGQARRQDDVRQFYLNKDGTPAVAAAANARARARSGDCKGALDAFDTSIRYWQEPTLRRDRGLCHEQLGNPYPAIEDYRAYLTGAPQATDYDQIKARLDALIAQYGDGQPSPQSKSSEPTSVGAGGSVELSYDGRVASSRRAEKDKGGGTKYVAASDREAYNSIYVEVAGSGLLWSINYDRLLGENVALRFGLGYVYLSTLSIGSHLLTLPLVVTGLVGAPEHKFEFGAGAVPFYLSDPVNGSTYKVLGRTGFSAMGTVVVGYRYQPEDAGFMFRIGFTPLFSDKDFLPWPGLSLGGTF